MGVSFSSIGVARCFVMYFKDTISLKTSQIKAKLIKHIGYAVKNKQKFLNFILLFF